MEKVAKAVLRYLFHQYLKGPTVLYEINGITNQYKADPIVVSNYLSEKNLIREAWIHQNNVVTCKITVQGIEEINPSFIREKLKYVMNGLREAGGRKSLTEIFQHKIEEYSIALDMIYELEKLALVMIIHNQGSIDIELTATGRRYADQQGKSLLALMTVA